MALRPKISSPDQRLQCSSIDQFAQTGAGDIGHLLHIQHNLKTALFFDPDSKGWIAFPRLELSILPFARHYITAAQFLSGYFHDTLLSGGE